MKKKNLKPPFNFPTDPRGSWKWFKKEGFFKFIPNKEDNEPDGPPIIGPPPRDGPLVDLPDDLPDDDGPAGPFDWESVRGQLMHAKDVPSLREAVENLFHLVREHTHVVPTDEIETERPEEFGDDVRDD